MGQTSQRVRQPVQSIPQVVFIEQHSEHASPSSPPPTTPVMPAPPFSSNHVQQQPLPALYLYPLNDSFIPKHIHLPPDQRTKIGRQTNAKTAPGERNGYFDSKVLSRQHAEVWEEGGKIYIKDVKSSNGTFINGERLSAEGAESEPFELKTDDIVEFGIDIVGEDNKTIVHHKVAARVVCVLTEQDASVAARVEQHQNPPNLSGLSGQPGSSNGNNAFNFSGAQGGPGPAQRRPTVQQGLVGIGGMGANMRQPGKSGLTFDHILNRLQGELQKSRETGAELHSLTGAMNDIHETLGGNIPQTLPPYPQSIPPVLPPQPSLPTEPAPNSNSTTSPAVLAELQSQLQDTQHELATHVDKIRALEGKLAEHEAIKREVSSLREFMEAEKREQEEIRARRRRADGRPEDDDSDFSADDDDTRSVTTVTPHELERVDEEDEEQLAAEEEEEEERRRRRDELGRPRTPEPTGMGMYDEDESKSHLAPRSRSTSPPPRETQASHPSPSAVPEDVSARLTTLSTQLELALELSRTLQTQHAAAQTTISLLESKVSALESLVQSSQTQAQSQAAEVTEERASLTALVAEWKKGVEGQWSGVKEEWAQERDRLSKARDEWETRMLAAEERVGAAVSKVDAGLSSFEQQNAYQPKQNGNARLGGLVTPPSPRSLSSDSGSGKPRQRKRRPSSRGRTRSHSTGSKEDGYTSSSEGQAHLDDKSSAASVAAGGLPPNPSSPPRSRPRSPWLPEGDSDSDEHDGAHSRTRGGARKERSMGAYPITPESSVRKVSSGSSATMTTEDDALPNRSEAQDRLFRSGPFDPHARLTPTQVQTAVGVLVLSVAAAAVLWRVKGTE
ncbi:hypothetical protein BV25DRAFT_1820172 [Artomyces pyxidatus]|uniref:Uncharacterized protein n=1 Tax=Artomyces pyxidatus TaxID=48021 RepID=A0ACB8TF15_9AGAM|nr:hypothetical protein BV25DRAFT_1820172 [Artomyces pyxidatus]